MDTKFTPTKILAYFVMTVGAVVSIILKSPEVITGAIWAAVAIISVRKAGNSVVDWKNGRYEQK